VHRSRIDRLDVPARSIFKSPTIFKREALAHRQTTDDRRNQRGELCGVNCPYSRAGAIMPRLHCDVSVDAFFTHHQRPRSRTNSDKQLIRTLHWTRVSPYSDCIQWPTVSVSRHSSNVNSVTFIVHSMHTSIVAACANAIQQPAHRTAEIRCLPDRTKWNKRTKKASDRS